MQFDTNSITASETVRNALAAAMNKSDLQNALWEKFIEPSLIVRDIAVFTCLAVKPDSTHAHRATKRVVDPDEPGETMNQGDFAFFTAPFRFPEYGPKPDEWTKMYAHEWQPPSKRTGLGYYWVFTLEHDPTDLEGIDDQFGWLSERKQDQKTLIDRIDAELRGFRDYRGYNATWSGNKSLHIHLVFDTTHLSLAALKSWSVANRKSAEAKMRDHYQGEDLSDHALKSYYANRWAWIVETVQELIGETISFDSRMAQLHQKRRLPWGTREAKDGNLLGIPAGVMVPQIVVAEQIILTSPRGSGGYFLSANEGNQFIQVPDRRHRGRKHASAPTTGGLLLDRLRKYLAEEWGREYPKPVSIEGEVGDLTVLFANHVGDQTPSTVCISPNANLIPGGVGAYPQRSPELRLPHGQTIDEIMAALQDELVGAGTYIPSVSTGSIYRERGTITQRILAARPRTKQGARDGLAKVTEMALENSDFNVFVSAEGVGKSFNLVHEAIRRRIEPPGRWRLGSEFGFNVFACLSYAQAEAQYQEWLANRDEQWPGPDKAHGVLLMSFSERYGRYCIGNDIDPNDCITEIQAAQAGFDSQIEGVYALHRDAYDAITKEKNDAWLVTVPGDNEPVSVFHHRVTTMLFTSHAMAQGFNQISKSKAWLHPSFEMATHLADGSRDYEMLATEFHAFQIIHDEIRPEDIAMVVSEVEYEFAERVRRSTQPNWDHASLPEKHRAYSDALSQVPKAELKKAGRDKRSSFNETRAVIDSNLTSDDIVVVDFDLISFGRDRNEQGIYRRQGGTRWYVREKDWWNKQQALISITTTERLPAMMLRVPRWEGTDGEGNAIEQRFQVRRWDDDEVFAFRSVPILRTNEASAQVSPKDSKKRKVEILVDDFLGQGEVDMIISDKVRHDLVVNHATARGRNDMGDLNLASVIMHLAPAHYSVLNVIAQKYGLIGQHPDVIRLHYRDQINQALGRNQGFRRDDADPKEHVVLIGETLYNWLGPDFFRKGRYPMYLAEA